MKKFSKPKPKQVWEIRNEGIPQLWKRNGGGVHYSRKKELPRKAKYKNHYDYNT